MGMNLLRKHTKASPVPSCNVMLSAMSQFSKAITRYRSFNMDIPVFIVNVYSL